MLFRKKSGKQTTPPEAAEAVSAETEPARAQASEAADPALEAQSPVPADVAIDFLAELLRTLGEHAFDVGSRSADEIGSFFETWARHLLVGVAPPRLPGDSTQPEAPDADEEKRVAKRDLPGLRRAFRTHRKAESEYVTRSLHDFREAAWAFIGSLRRTLTVEQSADRRLGHRMRRLEGAVRSGEADRIKSEAQETVSLLAEFLTERGQRHATQIREMATSLDSLRDELDNARKQASVDSLTQLYNRASFDEQIEREVDLAALFGKRGCLMMIDIDHFKWVNDTYGHPCGDAVLREVAQTLTRCYQRREDFVARYGGEEFAIVLRDLPMAAARDLAERGMDGIRRMEIELAEGQEPIRLTASIGLARLRPGESASSWVERADRALYQAKDAGRDRVAVDPIDLDEA